MTECVSCAKFKGCDLSSPNVNDCADYKEQMTNEEWFESLSTEEKAKFLRKIYRDGRDDYVGKWYEQTEKDFEAWLKQPHTVKE